MDAADAALERGLGDVDLVVLPRESSDSGLALYDDSVIGVVKALKSEGYEASFADDAEHRSWVGEKSAELVLALIVGVGSNAAWSGLVWLFRKVHADRRVEAKVARIERGTDDTTWEWGEFRGTGADVADMIEKWRDKPSGE